ncbi:MAG TPA: RT0821/Lpp0805 family surface protein [Stellaceae bacterium]|nr:RT0821/Lpp0805 family surface protein [Stellaceae bacterium]
MRRDVLILGSCLLLAECAAPGSPGNAPGEFGANKTTGGALVGAGLGGLAGSQLGGGTGKIITTVLGVLAGGLIGSKVGESLDRSDLAYAQRAEHQAFENTPSGTAVAWRNPDNGHGGTITPQPAFTSSSGEQCREFQQQITVGGQTQQGYGTACRQADGSWKIVS